MAGGFTRWIATAAADGALRLRRSVGRSDRQWVLGAALVGAVVFAYQLPVNIVEPTNLRWMMKADRGALLLEWLFERNEPWTLPFGILHNMMAPMVTIADGLLTVPSKLLFSWVTVVWQYSGLLLLGFYMLQGVFGYLVLRALGARRELSLLGAAFFALSPALLQRFEHVSLSAHWEILAAWWLYLRQPRVGRPRSVLMPWLLLVVIAIPTHPYIAAMVAAFAVAAYVRAIRIDKLFSWRVAAGHAAIALVVSCGVFWLFGYFVGQNHGEAGFGRFSADVFSFFNSAGSSSLVRQIPRMSDTYDLFGAYESYYYLGLGMIALLLVGVGLAIRETVRRRSASVVSVDRAEHWPPLWPAVAVALVLFFYALGTPVRALGYDVVSLPFYAHMTTFTGWFRGSGRFAWPLYYFVMALTIAEIARRMPLRRGVLLLATALILQVKDTRPLRAFVRRDYSYAWPRLDNPVWHHLGESFRSLRLVPPIVANRIACRHYDQPSDYEIKFGVVAAEQHMMFNSGSPARIDSLTELCRPMLDSLEHGFVDPWTVYVPSAPYREAIEWWDRGRVVCGTVEQANVCVARTGPNARTTLTQLLLAQERMPPPVLLHVDLRTGDQGAVDSTTGFGSDSALGRVISGRHADVFFGRPFEGHTLVVVDARAVDTTEAVPLIVKLNGQSRRIMVRAEADPDTLRFDGGPQVPVFDFSLGSFDASGAATAGRMGRPKAAPVRLRQLTISLE